MCALSFSGQVVCHTRNHCNSTLDWRTKSPDPMLVYESGEKTSCASSLVISVADGKFNKLYSSNILNGTYLKYLCIVLFIALYSTNAF